MLVLNTMYHFCFTVGNAGQVSMETRFWMASRDRNLPWVTLIEFTISITQNRTNVTPGMLTHWELFTGRIMSMHIFSQTFTYITKLACIPLLVSWEGQLRDQMLLSRVNKSKWYSLVCAIQTWRVKSCRVYSPMRQT